MNEPQPAHYKISRPPSDENLSWYVIAVVWNHANFYEDEEVYERSIAPATVGQVAVYACNWYLSEVYNGGHEQFFSNSTGMVWRDAVNGFRLIGAGPYSDILAEALSKFPNSKPAMDREERGSQMESIPHGAFDDLDKRIYDLEDAFDASATQYILAHPDQFFTTPNS